MVARHWRWQYQSSCKGKKEEPCWITIPHKYLLLPQHDKISCIVNTTLCDLHTNYADA
jgi:hypothetical protein